MNRITEISPRLVQPARFGLGLVMAALAATALAEAPASAEQCAACHHEDGITTEAEVPTIAGPSSFFIENQLFMFAEESRPCAGDYFAGKEGVSAEDHCALVAPLSEDEILELAGYYAELPFSPYEQEVDAELADQGASIHEKNCSRCHTEGGTLALDDAGILAGQPKPYLVEQIKTYQAGNRWKPDAGLEAVGELGDDEINAVVEFYAQKGQQ